MLISVTITPVLIFLDEYILDFQKWLPDIPLVVSSGLIPFILILSLFFLLNFGMRQRFKLNQAETFQASLVFLITAFIILTLTCVWFRGPGMKLYLGAGL